MDDSSYNHHHLHLFTISYVPFTAYFMVGKVDYKGWGPNNIYFPIGMQCGLASVFVESQLSEKSLKAHISLQILYLGRRTFKPLSL